MMTTLTVTSREDAEALLGAMPATSAGQTLTCPDGYITRTIQSGETLRQIASEVGLTLAELLMVNPTLNPFNYRTGTTLCVPAAQSTTQATMEEVETTETVVEDLTTTETETTTTETTAETDVTLGEETPVMDAGNAPAGVGPGPLPLPTPALPPETSGTTQQPVCTNGYLYTVRSGDTLRSIAAAFGITLEALMAANPGNTDTRITVGQQLCIPVCTQQTACAVRVRIPTGATFADVLLRYDVSFAALQQTNPTVDITNLPAGIVLCVPATGSRGLCVNGGGTYILVTDDSLEAIATNNGYTRAELLRANPNYAPSDFIAGRLICLPARS